MPFMCLVAILSITGCKKGGRRNAAKDTPETLEIYAWNGGYGVEWVSEIVNEFKAQEWVKEKYPNLDVLSPIINDNYGYAQGRLSTGTRNTIDLMFTPGARDYFGPSGGLVDLTDVVYNQNVPGEEIKFIDKMEKSYRISNQYTDPKNASNTSYYSVSWAGGMDGIIYNETILNSLGIKVPNTTNELIQACATIMSYKNNSEGKYNKGYSFIQTYDADYWDALFPIWWAQYEGADGFTNFYNGIDNNRYSKDIFKQQGRKYSLEVFQSILDYSKGYLAPESFRYEFMQGQLLFLQGNGVFHANGDWFDNEMRELSKEIQNMNTFKTMRTPILSKLGEKLGISDTELSKLVDYIDGNGSIIDFESSQGYTDEEVIEEITKARGIVHSIGPNHQAVIPSHAEGKEVAIDFLRFMASDIALESYARATKGNTLPFEFNVKEKNPSLYESFSTIQKSRIDYFNNGRYALTILPSENGFPLYNYAGLKPFIQYDGKDNKYFQTFSQSGNTDTPENFMQRTIDFWTDEKWSRALRDAGLSL